MPDATLYEILEVIPSARPAVIKAAYRCLIQECHPDRNPGDPEAGARVSAINHAYAVLSDPIARERYDKKLGIGVAERRGTGTGAKPAKTGARKGASMRPFAFRPLD